VTHNEEYTLLDTRYMPRFPEDSDWYVDPEWSTAEIGPKEELRCLESATLVDL